MAFDCFILKVASRCNLNCTYCYMYNMGDSTWRTKPRGMSDAVVEAAAHEIRSHALRHGLRYVHVTLHGGEPLLLGIERLQFIVDTLRAALEPASIGLGLTMQTNGTLLNRAWGEFFMNNRISVGISMDGPRSVHDAARVDHAGRGSYDRVVQGVTEARAGMGVPSALRSVLCVIDLTADPIALFEHFVELGFDNIDFLLPDAHYEAMPPHKASFEEAPYGRWLTTLFDAWFQRNDPSITIRLFEQLIRLILGMDSPLDSVGGGPVSIAVIETDGELEPLDVLKTIGHGLTRTGLNVQTHEIDALARNRLVQRMLAGADGLCHTCQRCEHRTECGGGYLPHRYLRGFDNPSVYCADLALLIGHIKRRVKVFTENRLTSKGHEHEPNEHDATLERAV